jgi:hypothetical protein
MMDDTGPLLPLRFRSAGPSSPIAAQRARDMEEFLPREVGEEGPITHSGMGGEGA